VAYKPTATFSFGNIPFSGFSSPVSFLFPFSLMQPGSLESALSVPGAGSTDAWQNPAAVKFGEF